MPNRYPFVGMPADVLFGDCARIENWCHENENTRPTLLDLDPARRARKHERRR